MKKMLILAALIAAPLALPLAAQAETAKVPPIQISTAGLDLRNPEDAAALIQRIEAAVRPICVAPGVAMRTTTAGCVRKATARTVKDLRIPELTQAFKQRSQPQVQFAGL